MSDAVELEIVHGGRQIVEKDDGAPAIGEEVLQGEDLPPITQRILGEEPHLRKTVEHDARRVGLLDLVEDQLRRLAELHLGRVEQRLLALGIEACLRRDQLEERDIVEGPAVPRSDESQLPLTFRKGDVEAFLAAPRAFQKIVQRQRRLSRAGLALDQVDPIGVEAAAENVV
jgi:hypothetical protein